MPPKRRKFSRPLGKRLYRKIFILAVEGTKTEPQYFSIFNDQNSVAVRRARRRDNPPCDDWPRSTGTTVYKLVENILKSHRN
jgi:hypothetical protein